MQLSSVEATMFKKRILFLPMKRLKKTALKRCILLWQFGYFYSAAPTAQNGPRLKIHNHNLWFRPLGQKQVFFFVCSY